ncbi:hypothetical protein ACFWYW_47055 [Nonomuraea sp. NPDC059023]|uniref:hypothetical protein n=1 Tax=unclassified Nonomuraea TaxID=2593643 RepID=UPI0036C28690
MTVTENLPLVPGNPASDHLVEELARVVRDRLAHDHESLPGLGDIHCANLTSYMGERMAPVLVRLRQAEQQIEMLKKPVADYHDPAYIDRLREVFTDTIRDMASRTPEDIARQLVLYTETAVWAAERGTARATSILQAVMTSVGTLAAEPAKPAKVGADGRLECPTSTCAGGIVELDWGWRHNDVTVVGPGELKASSGTPHFETAPGVYECSTCLRRVTLPQGYAVAEHA